MMTLKPNLVARGMYPRALIPLGGISMAIGDPLVPPRGDHHVSLDDRGEGRRSRPEKTLVEGRERRTPGHDRDSSGRRDLGGRKSTAANLSLSPEGRWSWRRSAQGSRRRRSLGAPCAVASRERAPVMAFLPTSLGVDLSPGERMEIGAENPQRVSDQIPRRFSMGRFAPVGSAPWF